MAGLTVCFFCSILFVIVINILKLFPIFLISTFMLLYLSACGKISSTETEVNTKPEITNFNFDWKYSCSEKQLSIYNISVDFKDPDEEVFFYVTLKEQPVYGEYYENTKRIFNDKKVEGKVHLGKDYVIKIDANFSNQSAQGKISKYIWIEISDPQKELSNRLHKVVYLTKYSRKDRVWICKGYNP